MILTMKETAGEGQIPHFTPSKPKNNKNLLTNILTYIIKICMCSSEFFHNSKNYFQVFMVKCFIDGG